MSVLNFGKVLFILLRVFKKFLDTVILIKLFKILDNNYSYREVTVFKIYRRYIFVCRKTASI